MKKFMLLYYAPVSALDQMKNASPEDMKKGMEPWMQWFNQWKGSIVDMGLPMANARKMTKSGEAHVSSKIAGYSIIQAEDMQKALEVVKNHPHMQWMEGAEVEVHEMLPMPGM